MHFHAFRINQLISWVLSVKIFIKSFFIVSNFILKIKILILTGSLKTLLKWLFKCLFATVDLVYTLDILKWSNLLCLLIYWIIIKFAFVNFGSFWGQFNLACVLMHKLGTRFFPHLVCSRTHKLSTQAWWRLRLLLNIKSRFKSRHFRMFDPIRNWLFIS